MNLEVSTKHFPRADTRDSGPNRKFRLTQFTPVAQNFAGGEAMRKVGMALLLGCCLLAAKAQTQKEPVPPVPKVKIGDVAPDFTLVDANGQPHSLHDYKGKKNVVLAFYVFAFTPK